MDHHILYEAVIIFGLSICVIVACHRMRVPAIIGFLLTGMLAGPHGLGLVAATHEVELLAEIGVILLLFVIGLELSLDELLRLKKPVFLGGGAQVVLTILAFFGLSAAMGYVGGQAVFIGMLAALSSTAIVLKFLAERAEMHTPYGRIALSVLIFQDIVVVPMMLLVPFISGDGGSLGTALLLLFGKMILVVFALVVMAKYIVPKVLYAVVRTRSRELFLMTTLGLCFGIALLTSSVGLSLSLGAFLAGLLISQSEYSLSALEGILPFRDIFTSIFFVSIGMLLNLGFFAENILTVMLLTAAVLLLKAGIVTLAGLSLGTSLRVALIAGLSLSQVGEFSFVLAGVGMQYELMSRADYQMFLAVAVTTMALTPYLIAFAPRVTQLFGGLPCPSGDMQLDDEECEAEILEDHLIIVGFGLGGRHLARAAKRAGVSYNILEMNPETVRREAACGEPIRYGDAVQVEVLKHMGIKKARVLAVVIADPAAALQIVTTAAKLNPGLHITVRTRFAGEIDALKEAGAHDVVAEEFETSLEIFNRVLGTYLVPRKDIERFTMEIRAEGYGITDCNLPEKFLDGHFVGHEIMTLTVEKGAPVEGTTLEEAALRSEHGLTVVAVYKDGVMNANPPASLRFAEGDSVYLFGEHGVLLEKTELFIVNHEERGGS
jgi:CPA2 family monovalent cation:H+ antiporter-2